MAHRREKENHTALNQMYECDAVKELGHHDFVITYRRRWFRRIFLLRCHDCDEIFYRNRWLEAVDMEENRLNWELII